MPYDVRVRRNMATMTFAPIDVFVLESHDVVKTLYERRHGGQLSSAKTTEVASCFSQGRQYLAAAEDAEPLVAPLLVYYGLNALARGTVLFLDYTTRIATMKPAHGLAIPSWQKHLAAGLSGFGELNIHLEDSGTFVDFTRVTAGDALTAFTPTYTELRLTSPSTSVIGGKLRVTIKQVLSRLPDIHEIYEPIVEEAPNVFAAGVTPADERDAITVEVFGERYPPDPALLERAIPAFRGVRPVVKTPSDSRPSAVFTVPVTIPDVPLPLRRSAGVNWLVVPFEPTLDLSLLPIYYMLSFATGMLCRYFPQHWLALLRGSSGDRFYPVVREAQAIIAARFRSELAAKLFA